MMVFQLFDFFILLQLVNVSSFLVRPDNLNVRWQTKLNSLDISRLTTIEVEDYVRNSITANGVAPIVIAIGATEQHGPTGLIGTDSQTSLAVARKVSEECNVLLGPQLQVGMSLHHCGFAGSASLRPSTLVNVICDIVWSLRQSSNLTHFYFINGHGGNVLPIKLAFAILRAKERPPWSSEAIIPSESNNSNQTTNDSVVANLNQTVRDVVVASPNSTFSETVPKNLDASQDQYASVESGALAGAVQTFATSLDEMIENNATMISTVKQLHPFKLEMVSWYANNESQALARSLYGDELGQHATPDEVAITKYLFPELQKMAFLDPEVLKATPAGRTARRVEGGADVENIILALLEGISDVDERNKIMFLGKMALNHMDPIDFRKRFADGRMWSNPGLATGKHGKLLFETSTKSVIENFRKFVGPE